MNGYVYAHEWKAMEEELAAKRERKARLVDDVDTLKALCEDVPCLPAFVVSSDREAFEGAWKQYDAKKDVVRRQVREVAKQAGIHNYAAELVVVADKLCSSAPWS